MLYIRIDVRHLCLRNFSTDMVNVVEEMVGTREAEVATESGGTVATESVGAVATESVGEVATESGGAVAAESGGRRQPAMRRLVTIRRRSVG